MRFEISAGIKIYDISDELMSYIEDCLKLPNPEYQLRVRRGMWVGKTPRFIKLYEIYPDYVLIPYGCFARIKPFMEDSKVTLNFAPITSVNYNTDVSLYDYQELAVNSMLKQAFGILQSKPGSGKTRMGIAMIVRKGKRALWLTHTIDLLNQAYTAAAEFIDKDLLAVTSAGKVHIGKGITFATVQTFSKLDLDKYKDMFDMVIVDECHRICTSAESVGMFYKVVNAMKAPYKYGLSATVHRSDGLIEATKFAIGDVAYRVPDEAIADKVVPVHISPVYTDVIAGWEARSADGMLDYNKFVNFLTTDESRNVAIVNLVNVLEGAVLILTDRVAHLEVLEKMLNRPDVRVITGKTNKSLREDYLTDMREGKANVLLATCTLAKEGLDIPRLTNLILATPHNDYAVITQALGRIARAYPDKTCAYCYDFVDRDGYALKSFKKRKTIYRKNGYDVE